MLAGTAPANAGGERRLEWPPVDCVPLTGDLLATGLSGRAEHGGETTNGCESPRQFLRPEAAAVKRFD